MPAAAIVRADHATRFTSERSLSIWKERTPEERKALARYAKSQVVHLERESPLADMFALVQSCLASPAETRLMLDDLSAMLGHSRTANILGLSSHHLSMLRLDSFNASQSLRKHVWLVWCMFLRPDSPKDGLTFMTSGRFTTSSGPQHAGRLAAPAARSDVESRARRGRSPDEPTGIVERPKEG